MIKNMLKRSKESDTYSLSFLLFNIFFIIQTHGSLIETFQQSHNFLDQKRVNLCEHMVKIAPLSCGAIFHVFTQIYSLLIEKDICDCLKISIKLPCVCMCLSSRDLFYFFGTSFLFLFLFFVLSVLWYFSFHVVSNRVNN